MPSNRPNRRSTWNRWTRRCASAAALSIVCGGWTLAPNDLFAQSGPLRFGRKPQPAAPVEASPTGFGLTVKKLMEQARREAAAGEIDAAIKTSQRARKIAEAASTTLGGSPDCSPVAADQLYREMLALRPSTSPAPTSSASAKPALTAPMVTATVEEPIAMVETPVVTPKVVAVPEPPRKPGVERWQPQSPTHDDVPAPVVAKVIAAPKADPVADEVYFPEEAPESVVIEDAEPALKPTITLKRSFDSAAPIATELGLESSLNIVGGDHATAPQVRPRFTIPLEEPAAIDVESADPDWMRSDAFSANSPAVMPEPVEVASNDHEPELSQPEPAFETSAVKRSIPALRIEAPLTPAWPPQDEPSFVEMTVLPASPEWETPQIAPEPKTVEDVAPARLVAASDWNSSGAVVRKRRISRSTSLQTDGWESTGSASAHVTRAGGTVQDTPATDAAAVATTAFRSNGGAEISETLPFVAEETVRVAPPPPDEVDELDVDLQSPTVWKREGIATVTVTEAPAATSSSPLWQQFSAWAQRCGWTATSAALGLGAAVLALAALSLALIPRKHRSA